MRIFAVSDLHVDYPDNMAWIHQLSKADHQQDILILAGDITDRLNLLSEAFEGLKSRFAEVLFVPGNHDLWVHRTDFKNSFDKLEAVKTVAREHGVSLQAFHHESLSIVPLLSWYDYSFRPVDNYIRSAWMDFHACNWLSYDDKAVTEYFHRQNNAYLSVKNETVITFSHFLPRVDIMPAGMPEIHKRLFSVFGSASLEKQVRAINPKIHVYGHSHLNRYEERDGTTYINNAFGYPAEGHIAAKALRCIHQL